MVGIQNFKESDVNMKVIAYSLWGNQNMYNVGMLYNIEDAPKIYPGWNVRVYCSKHSPVIDKLQCEVIPVDEPTSHRAVAWRYRAAADPNIERVIFRDADSRLSCREYSAVQHWIKSEKALHVMHENADGHSRTAILGGMWGVMGGYLLNIEKMIQCWINAQTYIDVTKKTYGSIDSQSGESFGQPWDEMFLTQVVWPMFKYGNYIGHGKPSEYGGDNHHPFDVELPGKFIGQKEYLPEEHQKSKIFRFIGKRKND